MKNKRKIIIVCFIFIIFIVCICCFIFTKNTIKTSTKTTDSIDSNINTDDDDEQIIWSNYENREITLTNSITITEEGIYNLSGTIEDGMIIIDTTGNVKLNLNNVTIISNNGPAIYIKNASDTVININGNNYLEDSEDYSEYTDIDGVIFSHDDLTIEGEGSLTIKANYQDGIVSNDDLKIINGNYIINSNDDGIRGKDSVYILDGNYEINSLGDGIKTTNDTDTEKGFIKISNGNFKIESSLDGIESENKIVIDNGEFNITTGGGSSNSSSTNENWGYWVVEKSKTTTTSSAKGLKSKDNLVINNGIFTLNTSDDSIHSNNYVGISDGTINIESGDDGIHADYELIIDNGTIKISKSYEGLESAKMTINGGNINIVSSDDGLNIAGGNDSSATNRPGENTYSNNDNILTINQGNIYINATGDGIDVNGSAYIYDGTITVEGPTDDGNGSLDYDRKFAINGGTLIASGSSGMTQSATSDSEQYNVIIYLTSTNDSSDKITIIDNNNTEIMSYTSTKNYSTLLFSSPKLQSNTTYTIKINGTEYDTFTTNTKCITVGNSRGNMSGNRPGRR